MMVILVDEKDRQIGYEEKLEAHKKGLLHRAFSIFIFNSKREMLLQKRSKRKYHSGNLWSNTCCSHPSPNEIMERSTNRRLEEEMGFKCQLKNVFSFRYRAELDKGMIEHEIDHVFIGHYDGPVTPNPKEAGEFKWMGLAELKKDVRQYPENYTAWFKIIFSKISPHHLKK